MPDENGKLTEQELRERWRTPEGMAFRDEIVRQLQSEETGHSVDWDNFKVSTNDNEYFWYSFQGVDEFLCSHIPYIDLRGISLAGFCLDKSYLDFARMYYTNFVYTSINEAELANITIVSSHFHMAKIKKADISYSTIKKSNFQNANFSDSNLRETNFINTNLNGAIFSGTDLSNVNFDISNLTDAKFTFKSFARRLCDVKNKIDIDEYMPMAIILLGIPAITNLIFTMFWLIMMLFFICYTDQKPTILDGAQLKNVRLDSDPVMYRKLLDEQYLDRFAQRYPLLYPFWLLTSNCGRSVGLVLLWSLVIGLTFGWIYSFIPGSFQGFDTWWHPYYFSFVTMTTLGMASIEPLTGGAAFVHTLQNLVGYAWLGYLVAVLGDKLTRRSA